MMSAPLRPAARTRTSNWPSCGSGSGRSATSIRPSTMVAARIFGTVLPVRSWCLAVDLGNHPDMAVPLPHIPPLWRETRAGVEAAALFRSSVWRGGGVPSGDGRPVLLIPGFMAGDGSLGTMTHWLRAIVYHTRRAGIRLNVGCSTESCARLEEKIERFAFDAGERVAIIG